MCGNLRYPTPDPHAVWRLEMEILRTDIRITDARLSDAIHHEEGLRSLHNAATDRVALLRSIKRDLQTRVDSICSANA